MFSEFDQSNVVPVVICTYMRMGKARGEEDCK